MGENNNLIRVGITGQSGFIGTHLYNFLDLIKDKIKLIPFEKDFFDKDNKLVEWVKQCDTMVHLAGINRHEDENVLFNCNIQLVEKLLTAVRNAKTKPHIIFSSSIQEELDNTYGKSKKKGRELFKSWAEKSDSTFTGLLIPNVFGPAGKPFYNSVIATFCHQLANNETPQINIDKQINLIYIQELVEEIAKIILTKINNCEYKVEHTSSKKVSEILRLLILYKKVYFEQNIMPKLNNKFEIDLFNTYGSYHIQWGSL